MKRTISRGVDRAIPTRSALPAALALTLLAMQGAPIAAAQDANVPAPLRRLAQADPLRGHAPSGGGTYWPVFNCADSGEGSLRAAVASAVSGDTVEMIGLSCGTITLSSAITIDVDDLTIEGYGAQALSISNGAKYGRVFTHTGSGTLQLLGMTISSGVVSPNSAEADTRGGCVFSNGNVALGNAFDPTQANQGVVVRDCTAVSNQAGVDARGGGVFATTGLTLAGSVVSGCRAAAQDAATRSEGGGVAVVSGAPFAMKYSEVRDNSASGALGVSGGIDAAFASAITVSHSTIAGNSASSRAGGAYLGTDNGADVDIDNTTISGNTSDGESALVINVQTASNPGTIHLASTTITANTSTGHYSAAFLSGPSDLNASIFSANTGGSLSLHTDAQATGADNIVDVNSNALPPSGLILSGDPGLAPLAANGGLTRTHALLTGSPAIDAGNDAVGSGTDQRGFARTLGARADIGAYERDPETIFRNGFD